MTLVIVTDLDGALLESTTCSSGPGAATLRRMRGNGTPLVLCSSRTRSEIDVIQNRLGLRDPFIAENGGAVYLPDGYFQILPAEAERISGHTRIELGTPYRGVVSQLREASSATGVRVMGFSDMTVGEVAAECGLEPLQAQLAKQREYDEPFRILDDDAAAQHRLLRALHDRGLRVVHAGRYYHATGQTDKGVGVRLLRELFARNRRRSVFAGLGDLSSDLSLLRAVDVPIIMKDEGSNAVARPLRHSPTSATTQHCRPSGWALAVEELLDRWEAGLIRSRAWMGLA